jgi:hypothetical protein
MLMRNSAILLSLFAALAASGCKQLECADGTIERDGHCEPANTTICGPFTELQGDRCVPQFPPTLCDPATTQPQVDPDTGVVTCIATSGGCGAALACPAPTGATKMTICGQLYDFETGLKFSDTNATGAECPTMPSATGPCSLAIAAYDALAFGTNPSSAQPLMAGSVYIDDCGRYRLSDIEINGTGSIIALGIDDAPAMGPTGTTVTVGVATPKVAMGATKDLEAFVVPEATTTQWAGAGGPTLTTGVYAALYRAHKLGIGDPYQPQAGVTITKNGTSVPANDFYFQSAETTRSTIESAAAVTGANGTALFNAASLSDGPGYGGSDGLGTGCRWETHAAVSLPDIVFVQIYRKLDVLGQTCTD